MSTLSHPNIIPFIGFYVDKTDLRTACVIMPYMSKGNVEEYLEDNDVDIQKRLELVIERIVVSLKQVWTDALPSRRSKQVRGSCIFTPVHPLYATQPSN